MNLANQHIKISFLIVLILASVFACTSTSSEKSELPISEMTDEQLKDLADVLAHKYIIIDGHVDLPYRMRVRRFQLQKEWLDVSQRTEGGDFDFPRSKEGGLDAPFMSIFVPSSMQVSGGAKELADSLITMVEEIPNRYPDKFALARTPQDIEDNFKDGLVSLPMGMENGAPIEDDLTNVKYFFDRGIRYVTLTHGTDNLICDSSYDTTRTWNGLSAFGREVVTEMNRVGIMVDISHVSDSTFYQVMEISSAPVIASHSSCRHFTPGFERNMSDDMIRRLGQNGGVIQINFGTSFLDGELTEMNNENRKKLSELLKSEGLNFSDSAAAPVIEKFREENPTLYSDVNRVADHIEHVVTLAGIDHVGFGSDFDGVGDSLPVGLKDVSDYPNLIFELLKRGFSEEDIEKICYKNVFRVWNKVIEISEGSSLSD